MNDYEDEGYNLLPVIVAALAGRGIARGIANARPGKLTAASEAKLKEYERLVNTPEAAARTALRSQYIAAARDAVRNKVWPELYPEFGADAWRTMHPGTERTPRKLFRILARKHIDPIAAKYKGDIADLPKQRQTAEEYIKQVPAKREANKTLFTNKAGLAGMLAAGGAASMMDNDTSDMFASGLTGVALGGHLGRAFKNLPKDSAARNFIPYENPFRGPMSGGITGGALGLGTGYALTPQTKQDEYY